MPIDPVGEIFERRAAELPGARVDHEQRRLTRLHAPHPGVDAGILVSKSGGDRVRRFLAEVM